MVIVALNNFFFSNFKDVSVLENATYYIFVFNQNDKVKNETIVSFLRPN